MNGGIMQHTNHKPSTPCHPTQQHPFTAVHVDLSNKPQWYRSHVNPRGLVPTLVIDPSTTLVESADIVRWLVQHRNADQRLLDAHIQAGGIVDGVIHAGLHCLAGRGRSWGIAARPVSVTAVQQHLTQMDAHLGTAPHGGPFLHGERPSVDDMLVYPFLRRFSVALPRFSGVDVKAGRPHLARWLDAMAARPSVQLAAADDLLLEQAYKEHMCLDFFDYSTYRATALHPLLDELRL